MSPTKYRFHHGEDDRQAYAVMVVVQRDVVPIAAWHAWVKRLGDAIQRPQEPKEWPTPTAFNAQCFLRALHLQLSVGVRGLPIASDHLLFADPAEHRDDLMYAVVEALRDGSPWLFAESS